MAPVPASETRRTQLTWRGRKWPARRCGSAGSCPTRSRAGGYLVASPSCRARAGRSGKGRWRWGRSRRARRRRGIGSGSDRCRKKTQGAWPLRTEMVGPVMDPGLVIRSDVIWCDGDSRWWNLERWSCGNDNADWFRRDLWVPLSVLFEYCLVGIV